RNGVTGRGTPTANGRSPAPRTRRSVTVTEPSRVLAGTVATLLGVDDQEHANAVAARVGTLCAGFPPAVRLGVYAGAGALDAAALVLTGRRLARLDAERRDELSRRLSTRPAVAALLDVLKVPALLASGGPGPEAPPAPARPDAELDCVPSGEWPTCTTA